MNTTTTKNQIIALQESLLADYKEINWLQKSVIAKQKELMVKQKELKILESKQK